MIEMWKPFCLKNEYKKFFLDKNIEKLENYENKRIWLLNFYNENKDYCFLKAFSNNIFDNWIDNKIKGKENPNILPIYVDIMDGYGLFVERFDFDCNNFFLFNEKEFNNIIDFDRTNKRKISKINKYSIFDILDGVNNNKEKTLNILNQNTLYKKKLEKFNCFESNKINLNIIYEKER